VGQPSLDGDRCGAHHDAEEDAFHGLHRPSRLLPGNVGGALDGDPKPASVIRPGGTIGSCTATGDAATQRVAGGVVRPGRSASGGCFEVDLPAA
jgi:hypothetical protein